MQEQDYIGKTPAQLPDGLEGDFEDNNGWLFISVVKGGKVNHIKKNGEPVDDDWMDLTCKLVAVRKLPPAPPKPKTLAEQQPMMAWLLPLTGEKVWLTRHQTVASVNKSGVSMGESFWVKPHEFQLNYNWIPAGRVRIIVESAEREKRRREVIAWLEDYGLVLPLIQDAAAMLREIGGGDE